MGPSDCFSQHHEHLKDERLSEWPTLRLARAAEAGYAEVYI